MLPSFVKETLTSRKGMLVEECQLVNTIEQPGRGSHYRMQVSNRLTENFKFCPGKANAWRLKSISCNRNEPKHCINSWQITEVSKSTKRHEDNSEKHAKLKICF